MRLILLSLLTFVLVGCGEIRLEVGSDDDELGSDDGEVGTYVWMPQPDIPRLDRFGNPQRNLAGDIVPREGKPNAYLVNTRTGVVQHCIKEDNTFFPRAHNIDEDFVCLFDASPTNTPVEQKIQVLPF